MAQDWIQKLRSFDAYPKTLSDFSVKTYSGAAVSLAAGVIMVLLFIGELNYFLAGETRNELYVDVSRAESMRINVDITFPKMPCAYMSIDAMDVSGETQLDVVHNLFKKRLNADGVPVSEAQRQELLGDGLTQAQREAKEKAAKDEKAGGAGAAALPADYCGSCYGAETPAAPCCNTCNEVRDAYRRKGWSFNMANSIEQCKREGVGQEVESQASEGCNVYGYLEVSKVAGNFHFAPGKSFQQSHMHVHDLQSFKQSKFNLTHTINSLSFGHHYPGIVNPLDGLKKVADGEGSAMYQYFVKVVPTLYDSAAFKASTNQFSVTQHMKYIRFDRGQHGLPGVFFMYDISPMRIRVFEERRSFMHFLTGVCAIVGGVFTVAGMVDSTVYHGLKSLRRKHELGKLG